MLGSKLYLRNTSESYTCTTFLSKKFVFFIYINFRVSKICCNSVFTYLVHVPIAFFSLHFKEKKLKLNIFLDV